MRKKEEMLTKKKPKTIFDETTTSSSLTTSEGEGFQALKRNQFPNNKPSSSSSCLSAYLGSLEIFYNTFIITYLWTREFL